MFQRNGVGVGLRFCTTAYRHADSDQESRNEEAQSKRFQFVHKRRFRIGVRVRQPDGKEGSALNPSGLTRRVLRKCKESDQDFPRRDLNSANGVSWRPQPRGLLTSARALPACQV